MRSFIRHALWRLCDRAFDKCVAASVLGLAVSRLFQPSCSNTSIVYLRNQALRFRARFHSPVCN